MYIKTRYKSLLAVAQIIIENNTCLVIGHERANIPNVMSHVLDKPIYFSNLASLMFIRDSIYRYRATYREYNIRQIHAAKNGISDTSKIGKIT